MERCPCCARPFGPFCVGCRVMPAQAHARTVVVDGRRVPNPAFNPAPWPWATGHGDAMECLTRRRLKLEAQAQR